MNEHTEATTSCNVTILRGNLHSEKQVRELPAGGAVAQFDVTVRIQVDGRESNVSVPVAWNDPTTAQLAMLVPGVEVVVIGTVRRRFFRVGGVTQSRTEVSAEAVIPVRRRKQVAAALRGAADRVLEAA